MADNGDLLTMKLVVLIPSTLGSLGNPAFNLIHLALSAKVLLLLFATCGIPLIVK
jgi:hypothetical protein